MLLLSEPQFTPKNVQTTHLMPVATANLVLLKFMHLRIPLHTLTYVLRSSFTVWNYLCLCICFVRLFSFLTAFYHFFTVAHNAARDRTPLSLVPQKIIIVRGGVEICSIMSGNRLKFSLVQNKALGKERHVRDKYPRNLK